MILNNSNNNYVFLNVFMFRFMSMTLININPQKEIFHHYDFPVYTTSKYRDATFFLRDPKLDTYRRITPIQLTLELRSKNFNIYIRVIPSLPLYQRRLFSSQGAGQPPLHIASKFGHGKVCYVLLQAGADVHAKSGVIELTAHNWQK